MIDEKDGHIPSPLIMFTCTVLSNILLEWHKCQGVYPNASKWYLKADKPDGFNNFHCQNAGGMILSYCAVTGCKLLTLPGIADTYPCLMNIWNTLPESYQQRVYNNNLATVKGQILQAEKQTPALVISVDTTGVDNAILHDYMT